MFVARKIRIVSRIITRLLSCGFLEEEYKRVAPCMLRCPSRRFDHVAFNSLEETQKITNLRVMCNKVEARGRRNDVASHAQEDKPMCRRTAASISTVTL